MMYLGNIVPFFGINFIGFFIWFIWWGIVLFAVIALARWVTHHNNHHKRSSSHAIEILKERYARGELLKKDFEEMKNELEKE